jgi:hypothetical protein
VVGLGQREGVWCSGVEGMLGLFDRLRGNGNSEELTEWL